MAKKRRGSNKKKTGTMNCPHCGAKISRDRQICPNCKKEIKPPFYKQRWFIALVVVVILASISFTKDKDEDVKAGDAKPGAQVEEKIPGPVNGEYESYTVKEFIEVLKSDNVEDYVDHFVEVKGKYGMINSRFEKLTVCDEKEALPFKGIKCRLQTEGQKEYIKECETGKNLTVRGKLVKMEDKDNYQIDVIELIQE